MQKIILENSSTVLQLNAEGGSYSNFRLKDLPVNPINWETTDPEQPPFKGHFLCFDRWGPPTGAEKANGFRHHGEVNTQKWQIVQKPQKTNNITKCVMSCRLPMGGLKLTRTVELPEGEPVFFVSEEIKNLNQYGRMFNIVQHVTLAPPFLDPNTLFDNNTEKGFEDKEDGSLNQEKPVLKWPEVRHNHKKINLRKFQDEWPRVSTFAFPRNEKYGWVTAANPEQNLLLGYIWETEDYPWINFWRHMEGGIPVAFGMEFGTTGLHEPFPVVAKKAKIFDRNIFEFIDAGEVIRKSFSAFLTKIPSNYRGVKKIELTESAIILSEKDKKSSNIIIQINFNQ
jgi:hypothetical protein